MDRAEVGRRIRGLRGERGWGLRELARRSGLSAGHLSGVEAGRTSPTVASLLKILEALDTTAPVFFAAGAGRMSGVRVAKDDMPVLDDGEKRVRYLLPAEVGARCVLTYEVYQPHTLHAEHETHPRDLYVYVLQGVLTLEVEGAGTHRIAAGDAAVLRAGTTHVASNAEDGLLTLMVVEAGG